MQVFFLYSRFYKNCYQNYKRQGLAVQNSIPCGIRGIKYAKKKSLLAREPGLTVIFGVSAPFLRKKCCIAYTKPGLVAAQILNIQIS